MPYYVPSIFEQSSRGERFYDIYSRLLKDRIVFIQSAIDDGLANIIVGQLLFLDADDPEKDIYLYINTPGGSVTAGLAIYDTMQYIKSHIQTVCIGQAASMGAVLLAAGTEGKRHCLPHSRIIIHQPLGGATGQATDIEIQANELLRMRRVINTILVKHTNKPLSTIEKDADRDFFMTADEALSYGIIDSILKKNNEQS